MQGTGERVALLENASAGTSAAKAIAGGLYVLTAEATFGGGNLQLQYQTPVGTWINYSTTFTAAEVRLLELPPGQYRVVTTTSSAVYLYASRYNR